MQSLTNVQGFHDYFGYVVEDKPHGLGSSFVQNNRLYVGDYFQGKYNGYGRKYHSEGWLMYEGEWVKGKKQGFGIQYIHTGAMDYKGYWVCDKFDGEGILYDNEGGIEKEGLWEKDILVEARSVNFDALGG